MRIASGPGCGVQAAGYWSAGLSPQVGAGGAGAASAAGGQPTSPSGGWTTVGPPKPTVRDLVKVIGSKFDTYA